MEIYFKLWNTHEYKLKIVVISNLHRAEDRKKKKIELKLNNDRKESGRIKMKQILFALKVMTPKEYEYES